MPRQPLLASSSGEHRVMPCRIAVSRSIGDHRAKARKLLTGDPEVGAVCVLAGRCMLFEHVCLVAHNNTSLTLDPSLAPSPLPL